MELALAVFPLTWRKKLTVSEALENGKWMQGLQRVDSELQLDRFIRRWIKVQGVTLFDEREIYNPLELVGRLCLFCQ